MFARHNLNGSTGIGYRTLGIASALVLGLAALLTVSPGNSVTAQGEEGSSKMGSDIATIEAFIQAFNDKDIDKIMTFFTEDAIYHNLPTGPVQGTEAVRNLITMFVSPADKVDWEILNIAQTGNTVLTERMDRFVIKGKDVHLPIMGAFDMQDGKIVEWRDYFDMATWQKQNAQ